jgi:hypothetical protein
MTLEAKLNWKRTKLANPEWIEGIAPVGGGASYRIRGTGSEYVVGYHRPRSRRDSFLRIGTATNVPDAMALAQAHNDQQNRHQRSHDREVSRHVGRWKVCGSGVMRYRRRRPEDAIHRVLLQHLRLRAPRDCFFTHFPAGGARPPVEAAIMKGLGVRAGVPDLLIVHEGTLYGLELKADGRKSTALQEETQEALRRAGAVVATAVGLDAALKQLERWHLLKGWSS